MKNTLFFTLAFTALCLPSLVLAQPVSAPLVDLNLPPSTGSAFNGYINGLYILSISLAALLAVIKIIIAGAKYAFTDVISAKGNAKEDIQSALFGLLLIMGAVLILELINPRLTTSNIEFQKIDIVVLPPGAGNAPVTSGGNGAVPVQQGVVPVTPSKTPSEYKTQLYDLRDTSVGQATTDCTKQYGQIGKPNVSTNMIGCTLPKAPPVEYRRVKGVNFDQGLAAFQQTCTAGGGKLADKTTDWAVINKQTMCAVY